MATDARKVILVADSHTRLSSFLNWLETNKSAIRKKLEFPGKSKANAYTVGYAEVPAKTNSMHIYGVEKDHLGETEVLELARDPHDVVVQLTKRGPTNARSMANMLSKHPTLLVNHPAVHLVSNREGRIISHEISLAMGNLGYDVRLPTVDGGDFNELWQYLEIAKSKRLSTANANPAYITTPTATQKLGETEMASVNDSLAALMQIEGAVGALLADYSSGMLLAKAGGGVNLDVAAAGNTEVIRAKMKTINALGLKEAIEDILITLGTQYHIIRPMASNPGLFIYLVLDKAKANLAMARYKVLAVEKALTI